MDLLQDLITEWKKITRWRLEFNKKMDGSELNTVGMDNSFIPTRLSEKEAEYKITQYDEVKPNQGPQSNTGITFNRF